MKGNFMWSTPAFRIHSGIRLYGYVYPEYQDMIFWTMKEPNKTVSK